MKPLESIARQKCSTFDGDDRGHKSQEDYSSAAEHNQRLTFSGEYYEAAECLNSFFENYLIIEGHLCGTAYRNVFCTDLHCIEKEHFRSEENCFQLAKLATRKESIQRWRKLFIRLKPVQKTFHM